MHVYYDLHMHSCLSPCGDMDMTPNNLVNMAAIQELQVIALTDHNASQNCPAAIQAAEKAGIILIPGMELNTSEEIHVICLFETLEGALEFEQYVNDRLPPYPNDPDIFGRQVVLDAQDQPVKTIPHLLIQASEISVMETVSLTKQYGGIAFPAHIDKPSYSVLAALGDIPPECGFTAAEITAYGNIEKLKASHSVLQDIPLLKNSDAHYLEHIQEPSAWLDLPEISVPAVLDALRRGKCAWGRERNGA